MVKGRILIIEQDEWESTLLAKFLGDAGFQVHVAAEARAGLEQACALEPDCILCDVDLPDIDGFWVARRLRTEPSPAATTPFLFLTNAEDTESHLQGLNVGADLYLTRPFHEEEVVAQVSALIEMANRLRQQQPSPAPEEPSSSNAAAFSGDIAQVSVATVLSLLELERRSGYLKVRSDSGGTVLLELTQGMLACAILEDKQEEPTAVLRETLRWKSGRFTFRNAEVVSTADARHAIGGLLIEAMRLEDEAARS